MARQVKCKGCGNSIDKEKAYCHIHTTKSGKEQKQYYCNEKEFLDILKEKHYRLECQYATDWILDRPITNNARNKRLSELHEHYTYEEIFKCIEYMKEEIKSLILTNDIQGDFPQIQYMFACINNSIYDFIQNMDNRTEWEILMEKQKQEDVFVKEEEYKPQEVKVNRKSIF